MNSSLKILSFARLVLLVLTIGQDLVWGQTHEGVRVFNDSPFPEKLSEWRLFLRKGENYELNRGVIPYDLNNSLFTDYALKFRTVWLPPGTEANYQEEGTFEFPQGTILSKTFYYPSPMEKEHSLNALPNENLIETRLLVKTKKGWIGLPYVWNEDKSEAILEITGASKKLLRTNSQGQQITFQYHIPNMNQCKSCHMQFNGNQRLTRPIGPTAMNLNKTYPYRTGVANQLVHWQEAGYLKGAPTPEQAPRAAIWNDHHSGTINERARAYLDINCAHCHNPSGPAKNSRLFLNIKNEVAVHLGLCKSPVAVGNAGGGLPYAIFPGKPEKSIMIYRMNSSLPEVMMPEIGRSLIHEEGVQLISDWISQMTQTCPSSTDFFTH